MALKSVALTLQGAPKISAANLNTQTTLIAAALSANEAAGAKADVSAEIAAISANLLSGALVVTVDTDLVTTKKQLRNLFDAAYSNLADAQSFLT